MILAVQGSLVSFVAVGGMLLSNVNESMQAEVQALQLSILALMRLGDDFSDVAPSGCNKIPPRSELPDVVLKCSHLGGFAWKVKFVKGAFLFASLLLILNPID